MKEESNWIGGWYRERRGSQWEVTYHTNWKNLTTDQWILEVVSGYHLELHSTPHQRKWPREQDGQRKVTGDRIPGISN